MTREEIDALNKKNKEEDEKRAKAEEEYHKKRDIKGGEKGKTTGS